MSTSGSEEVSTRPIPSRTTGWSSMMSTLGIAPGGVLRLRSLGKRQADLHARASAWPPRDPHLAAGREGSLFHAEQPHRRRVLQRLVGNPLAIVTHLHGDPARPLLERDPHRAGMGVPGDVGQRFEQDAVKDGGGGSILDLHGTGRDAAANAGSPAE